MGLLSIIIISQVPKIPTKQQLFLPAKFLQFCLARLSQWHNYDDVHHWKFHTIKIWMKFLVNFSLLPKKMLSYYLKTGHYSLIELFLFRL